GPCAWRRRPRHEVQPRPPPLIDRQWLRARCGLRCRRPPGPGLQRQRRSDGRGLCRRLRRPATYLPDRCRRRAGWLQTGATAPHRRRQPPTDLRRHRHRRYGGQAERGVERAGGRRGPGAHRARRQRRRTGQDPRRRRSRHPNGSMISSLHADAFVESPVAASRLTVRKAVMHDIAPLLNLINSYASRGIMLARTEFEMSEAIRDFSVVTLDGQLLGCGALHFYSPTTAEIRSLAVHEHAKTKGVGRKLVEALVAEAVRYELDAVFAFTYVVDFFNRMGFHVVERGELPLKAWKDCVRCPKFQACDEVAVVRILRADHWAEAEPQPWGPLMTSPSDELIQIPTPRLGNSIPPK